MAGAKHSSSDLTIDDRDFDDAELWAVIDSAAASRLSSHKPRRAPLLSITNTSASASPNLATSPHPAKTLGRTLQSHRPRDHGSRASPDGEVVEEDGGRPPKMARFADPGPVMLRPLQQSPVVTFPSPYSSPDVRGISVQEMRPAVEMSPSPQGGFGSHSMSGPFPSVALFKQYQSAALAILEKTDYTMLSGRPYIKKTGWRKISFYFNLSYEIKDKSIEFDENRNVQRAEFVVRAFMQGGRFADGWGSCEQREKRFSKPNHDIPSMAETRAKNRACQGLHTKMKIGGDHEGPDRLYYFDSPASIHTAALSTYACALWWHYRLGYSYVIKL